MPGQVLWYLVKAQRELVNAIIVNENDSLASALESLSLHISDMIEFVVDLEPSGSGKNEP